jgi:hypothetical protein
MDFRRLQAMRHGKGAEMTTPNGRARHNWRRTTAGNPCPICKTDGWCSVTADGNLAKCMKVEAGAWKVKADKNGTPYYLHRLAGGAGPDTAPPPRPPGPETPRADADLLHRAYSALLTRLQLSKAHREALRGRGLPDEEIDRRGYRTLTIRGRARVARELRERLGDALLSVPGFVLKPGDDGKPYLTIAGAAGLLVPVRDVAERVIALLVRRDDAGDAGGKYSYLSSAKHGGPGPGAPPHVPLGGGVPAEIVRLTEGALKADVAAALSGFPTAGAAGLAWRPALDVLGSLGCKTVRLAFDADALDNAHVARALSDCSGAAAAAGLAVELERWDKADGKGIDELLAAGKTPELLTGEAVLAAIREAVAAATAGEPPPAPDELDRLADVLADGGAEALFRDRELLRGLARIAETNPAEFACRRAQLQRAGVKLRDLDRTLAPLRQEFRREQPPIDAAGCYRVSAGRIVRDVLTKDGPVEVTLTNWSGRIVEQTVHDDGAERHLTFAVEGALADGTSLARADVPAEQFAWMRWPVETWGTRAVILAGASTADHVRVALQLLSGDVPHRVVYGHTGWRDVGGDWVYLHARGAIGGAGTVPGVAVALDGALGRFELPSPPGGAELVNAVRASLGLLDLGPDRITVPVYAAVFRAALGEADFAGGLTGPTGAFKTEVAALAQQHYGRGMDARNMPASWSSTGNALEGLAFAAKDALLCVDDFAPTGSTADVQRMHREADRVLRAQGNRAGRARCRTDGTVRVQRAPRGLILSTGEDVPRGQSLRARLFVVELAKGDISPAKLTTAQRDAAAGLYAACMAGYLRWLAPRYSTIRAGLRQEHAALREKALAEGNGQHARTPGIVADLALGVGHFLSFAVEAGAITIAERDALARRCWAALGEVAAAQAEHVQAAEPSGQFLRLFAGVVASGRGHLAGPGGKAPDNPERWGWRCVMSGGGERAREGWQPQGHGIGWVDGEDVFLEPEAAYAAAQALAREQGDSLAVAARTLWKRMDEQGLLASRDDGRQRYTIRRRLRGHDRQEVLHFRADTLSPCTRPSRPSPALLDGEKPDQNAGIAGDGRGDGCAGGGADRPRDRPQEPQGNPNRNGVGDGRDGRIQEEPPPTHKNSAPHSKRRRGAI